MGVGGGPGPGYCLAVSPRPSPPSHCAWFTWKAVIMKVTSQSCWAGTVTQDCDH